MKRNISLAILSIMFNKSYLSSAHKCSFRHSKSNSLIGHWCGMAKGHVQGSFHGAQLGFRCHKSFCVCFHYWIVVAEFSPNLPSPSWHGKYEVSIFVSTVLSVWPCLGVANLNIIMDNFCIWFDWLAAPPSLIQQSQHTDITDYWDKNSNSTTTYSIIFFLSLTFLSCCPTHSKRIDLKGPQLHLKIINF